MFPDSEEIIVSCGIGGRDIADAELGNILFWTQDMMSCEFSYPVFLNNVAVSNMELFSRMFCCQNIHLFRHRNMGIYFRNIDRTVSKHFLDVADIYICF